MHTGYDYNYWMYQNQRPEPVKIDSHSVCTDNYKQVRGMGGPCNSYNYIPPPNNIPRPRKKFANDQQRVTNYQNMWPSSVYSLPFRSSQTQNYHSEEAFPVQPNNMYDSAQPMQNCNFSQIQNPNNVSFPQVRNVNFKGTVNNLNNQNAKTPRIRVKDVSSLNNNFIDKNSVLDNCVLQHQKTKQRYNSFNSAAVSQNRLYNNEAQREHVNYDRNMVPELAQSYPHYGPHGTHTNYPSNGQQYHISGSFYKQNAGYVNESQNQFNTIQQMDQLSETYNTNNYLPVQMSNNKTVQSAAMHNAQLLSSNGMKGNEVVTSQLSRNLVEPNGSITSETNSYGNRDQNKSTTYTFSDMLDSSKMSTVSQFENQKQHTLPAVPQCPLVNPLSPPDSPVTQSAGQNTNELNTSIQHCTENTVIRLAKTNFAELKRNSALCLFKGSTVDSLRRNSLPEESYTNVTNQSSAGSCQSSLTSPKAGYTCQTPGRSILNINSSQQQLEQVDDCETNEQNITNDAQPEHRKDRSIEEAASCQNQTKDGLPALEVSSAHSEKEDFENEVPVIKIEDDSFAPPTTEQRADQSSIGENQMSSVGDDEKINSPQPEPIVFLSENSECASKTSTDLSKVKSRLLELETFDGNRNKPENNIEKEIQKTTKEKLRFQSKINRNKLNMLINFLNEDERSIDKQELCKTDFSAWLFSEKESSLRPNRRKMSKACVVKNKNNEREAISLMSPKTSKYYLKFSCINSNSNPNDLIEVNGFTESEIESSNSSESTVILEKNQNAIEQIEEGKRLNETIENSSYDQKVDTSEETKLINIMRAFQNLKNHFCANCDFISPVGSLWINVVSGELRCLNCFRKMICKAEENFKKCQKNFTRMSQAESTQKIEKGEKNGNNEETNKKNLNNEISNTSIDTNSKLNCGNKNGDSEVRVKEEDVVTHTDEELKEKDTEELSNTLKISASEAEKALQRRKSSEEKKTEKTAEKLTKSDSSSLSSSKHDGSKSILKRDRHSTECKITEKEVKNIKRQASEEVVKPEVSKNKEEKSSKSNSAREDESKKENRKRTNTTSLSHVPLKVQIVEDSAKEDKKKEDDYYQKEREEYSKKAKKLIEIFNKRAKKITPISKTTPEQTKGKERESINTPEKIISKEDSAKKKSEERDVFKSLKKETKHEKTKTKDSEQPSKSFYSKETSQGNKEEKNKTKSSQTHSHHHKGSERHDSTSSKALKEKSHSKTHSEGKHIEKETHKSHEHKKKHKEKKEGRKSEENPKKKIREEKIDGEKKKGSMEKFEKSQKEKKFIRENDFLKRKSDKAVECSFGEILKQMDTFPMSKNALNKKPNSDSLLAKLMKKTKKLSQTLLDDAQ